MVNGAFVHELADCRTFCRRAEVEAMQATGWRSAARSTTPSWSRATGC